MLRFGMDTVTLGGTLEAKLQAIREGGFSQVMVKATDLVNHEGGVDAATRVIKASGLRITGFQVLRDFEGLPPSLRRYKLGVADAMLEMAQAIGAPLLLVCSSTSRHASRDLDTIAEDLALLAAQARALDMKVAYEGLSWGCAVHEFTAAWEAVRRTGAPNLGVAIDSFHTLATHTPLAHLDSLDTDRIFLVQLADFLWPELPTPEDRITTGRHFRVFPGEGAHDAQVAELVARLQAAGYAGDYSFEVFNDDYQQMPLPLVVQRARGAAQWLRHQLEHDAAAREIA